MNLIELFTVDVVPVNIEPHDRPALYAGIDRADAWARLTDAPVRLVRQPLLWIDVVGPDPYKWAADRRRVRPTLYVIDGYGGFAGSSIERGFGVVSDVVIHALNSRPRIALDVLTNNGLNVGNWTRAHVTVEAQIGALVHEAEHISGLTHEDQTPWYEWSDVVPTKPVPTKRGHQCPMLGLLRSAF